MGRTPSQGEMKWGVFLKPPILSRICQTRVALHLFFVFCFVLIWLHSDACLHLIALEGTAVEGEVRGRGSTRQLG